jgi:predicted dehydrogenase
MMKLAIVGLGWWGKELVKELHSSQRIRVTHGVDLDAAAVADFARQYDFKVVSSLGEILENPEVDAVAIVTPHSLHEEQVLAVVQAGKQVFCEKPLAMNAASARRILEACEKSGRKLGIGHERRYEGAYERAQQLVKSGALGRIICLDANISHNQFRNIDPSNWRLSKKNAPAGLMTGPGIHLTDLFVTLAGPAKSARARTGNLAFAPPAEDFMTAQIEFVSGAFGSLTGISSTPFYGRFTIYGDEGWVEVIEAGNVDSGLPTTLRHKNAKGEVTTESFMPSNAARLNLEAWVGATEGRAEYRFTREEILANISIFEAIVTSAAQGGAVVEI